MSTIYLIPSLLAVEGLDAIPPYVAEAIKDCQVFFAENERTTTHITKLSEEESIREVARLLGGAEITKNVLDTAKEMKDMANRTKESVCISQKRTRIFISLARRLLPILPGGVSLARRIGYSSSQSKRV